MKDYLVLNFRLKPLQPTRDILLALLDNLGYDSFEEVPTGLRAYILEKDYDPESVAALPVMQNPQFTIDYETEKLASINWNEEWERNYEPVALEDKLYLRAPFHPAQPGFRHEIVIEPKMSFGTGHHHTTRLMARAMFELDFAGKEVLDMGTGTGVLAILAERLGATAVLAVDNFEWAVENTAENALRNQCSVVEAKLGDADLLPGLHFDIVLANINRNVLLDDLGVYCRCMSAGGELLLSGFFEHDFALIDAEAHRQGMDFVQRWEENRWLSCRYRKA